MERVGNEARWSERPSFGGNGLSKRSDRSPPPADVSPWPLQRHHYTVRYRAYLPSTKAALNGAVHEILQVADRCGCLASSHADLEIALREALANAIIHGNAYHNSKQVFVRCYGAPGRALLVIVRDEGPGFDPEDVPDPRDEDRMHLHHGRGLLLMRELMDYVEYRKQGREVILFNACSPPGDST